MASLYRLLLLVQATIMSSFHDLDGTIPHDCPEVICSVSRMGLMMMMNSSDIFG